LPATSTVELRFLSYLAPSLPRALFRGVVGHVAAATGMRTSLRFETRASGPRPGGPDPFSTGEVDVAFLCSPAWLWLSERRPSPVALVPAAPVFDDPRAGGRPVYFSDVVVRSDGPVRDFAGLAGRRFAYNDTCSLSGWLSLLQRLASTGAGPRFLGGVRASGSHLRSIDAVVSGSVDAAAIDSNVLALAMRRDPALASRLRVIESWGPYPIQPVVARAALPRPVRAAVAEALLTLHFDPAARRDLAAFGLARFAPTSAAAYEEERRQLAACAAAPRPRARARDGA
jgi:ABC-type phosphate/phosphonate transport system substrate-binding protein